MRNTENVDLPMVAETQLVALFEAQQKKLARGGLRFFREFECANGVADLVIVRLRKDWQAHLSTGEITPRWLYALRALPYRKCFSTEEFARLTGASRERALAALLEYIASGFCRRSTAKDCWIKLRQPQLIAAEVCAVEAKLSDWRRALRQAERYLDFAEQSWVLLDSTRVSSALAKIEEFQRLNVGLISQSSSGVTSIWFRPAPRLARSEIRRWQSSAIIASNLRAKDRGQQTHQLLSAK